MMTLNEMLGEDGLRSLESDVIRGMGEAQRKKAKPMHSTRLRYLVHKIQVLSLAGLGTFDELWEHYYYEAEQNNTVNVPVKKTPYRVPASAAPVYNPIEGETMPPDAPMTPPDADRYTTDDGPARVESIGEMLATMARAKVVLEDDVMYLRNEVTGDGIDCFVLGKTEKADQAVRQLEMWRYQWQFHFGLAMTEVVAWYRQHGKEDDKQRVRLYRLLAPPKLSAGEQRELRAMLDAPGGGMVLLRALVGGLPVTQVLKAGRALCPSEG